MDSKHDGVLNLIINGIPSIPYKLSDISTEKAKILNLIINGIPSIHIKEFLIEESITLVLNLIINGIPSIPKEEIKTTGYEGCFKPYYKWNTFNTFNYI